MYEMLATCMPFALFFAILCVAAFCGGVSVGVCIERKQNGKGC